VLSGQARFHPDLYESIVWRWLAPCNDAGEAPIMNRTLIFILAASALAFAQPPTGGWRRAGDQQQQQPPAIPPGADPEPVDRRDAFGQPVQGQPAPTTPPPYGLPPELTLKPGVYLTVRLDQTLSSDRNRPGDSFVGSLAQPIVVDGVVVAHRNQQVYGRVTEAERSRSNYPSRLGVTLTSVTLADGSQVPIRTQLAIQQGDTLPKDAQFATVAGTTAAGATIGAIAGWGRGAAIGAGVGAMAGLAGVMLTRNRPTVLYPETVLTFAVVEPLTVTTTNAPHAFRFVGPEDYNQPPARAALQPRPSVVRAPYPPVWSPYPYPPYYGGVSVVVGRPWGWGGYRRWGRPGRWWW
jgi:hypothetical protein